MYGCESWIIKKAENGRTDAFELGCWRRLLSTLDFKEIQPVHSKGNQSWIFIGRTHAEAETPILWPPVSKTWLIGKTWCWESWRQEEKGMIEDEMAGWHHWLDGHEFEQTPGVGDGQGGLACCNPWDRKKGRYDWVTKLMAIHRITSFDFKKDWCNCYETHLDQSENNSLKIKEWENFNRKSANKKESEAERVMTKRNLTSSLLRKYVLFHIKTCIHKRDAEWMKQFREQIYIKQNSKRM